MSYKIYPVTQTELKFEGYEVKINGEKVDTDTARVSKWHLTEDGPATRELSTRPSFAPLFLLKQTRA